MSGSDNLLAFLLVTIRVYRGLIGEARYGMLAIAWLRLRYLTLLYRRLRKTDLTSFSAATKRSSRRHFPGPVSFTGIRSSTDASTDG